MKPENQNLPSEHIQPEETPSLDGLAIRRNINFLIHMRGWTVYRLSAESGVPCSTLYELLNGPTREPRIETLQRIAGTLGVDPAALYGEAGAAAARSDGCSDLQDMSSLPSKDAGDETLLRHIWRLLPRKGQRLLLEYACFLLFREKSEASET